MSKHTRGPWRGTGRSLKSDRGRRITKGLLLAGAAVGLPVLAGALLRRRAEPPSPPRWGRSHRYAGRSGAEVAFQELGSGPPIVLLHAFGPGYDANQWRAAAEILAARHSVYVPDFPGWGRTRPGPGAHHPDRYLSLLEDFLAGVVRERAVLVGAGLAAAFAVQAAADHPGRVRALALVSPLGLEEASVTAPVHGFTGRLLALPLVSASVLDLLTSRAALEHHLRREVYAAPERVDAALLEHHYRASHTKGEPAPLSPPTSGAISGMTSPTSSTTCASPSGSPGAGRPNTPPSIRPTSGSATSPRVSSTSSKAPAPSPTRRPPPSSPAPSNASWRRCRSERHRDSNPGPPTVFLRTQKNEGRIFDVPAEKPSQIAQGFNPGADRARTLAGGNAADFHLKKASRIPVEDSSWRSSCFAAVRVAHELQRISDRAIIPRKARLQAGSSDDDARTVTRRSEALPPPGPHRPSSGRSLRRPCSAPGRCRAGSGCGRGAWLRRGPRRRRESARRRS